MFDSCDAASLQLDCAPGVPPSTHKATG